MSGAEGVRAQALEVAAGWSGPDAPGSWQLTAALFRVIAGHPALLARLAGLPADTLPALLASAAISLLIRRDGAQPLAGYFPVPGRPQPPYDPGFEPAAAAFISARMDEIIAVCQGRRYQMNEVARCAQIAAGIAAACPGADPVALVDIGTGAGFGLHLDRYRYQLGDQLSGPPESPLTLHCEVRGAAALPRLALPPVSVRAGLDLSPVDLADPAAADWLLACTPPEASALTRLTAAVTVARQHPERIVSGDVVDELPGVLAELPRMLPVLVTDAYLAVFLPPARRQKLTGILRDAGRSRPVTWLSLDPLVPLGPAGRDSVQGVPLPTALVRDYRRRGVFAVLTALTFDGTAGSGRLLARAHPSGQWLEWLG